VLPRTYIPHERSYEHPLTLARVLRLFDFSYRLERMDFRVPNEHEESDAAILDEPYRPFYNIFRSKPILVKQYEVANYDDMAL
jgi:hypothetical protein